jgi:hypothetical protein
VTCRRAAEFELRRAQSHLEAAEAKVRGYQWLFEDTPLPGIRSDLAFWQAQVEELESRLRELTAGGELRVKAK